jgi:S-DNA-T family DNA segregation ATPase FtsK/SpoIIIE
MSKVNRQLLEYQADRIEMALYANRISGRVAGGLVTPRFVRYTVALQWTSRVEQVLRLENELSHRLGVANVRVALVNGQLAVEVPRLEGQIVHLWPLCRQMGDVPARTAVLGIGETGVPLLLALPSPDVGHVLVAGTTGSGKSALARTMALSLAMHSRQGEVQLAIIDPKGRDYRDLVDVPHMMRPIAVETEDAAFFLGALVQEMLERDRQRISEPRIVVVIDELADLIEAGGADVLNAITRLTQRGRGAGIHVIGCTQKPTAASIGSLVKSNFPARLVGSVTSPEDAKVASGMKATGAERLTGQGDFLLVLKGKVTRFQAAFADGATVRALVARMATGRRQSRMWLTEYPLESAPALPGKDSAVVACPPEARLRLNRWVPRVVVDNRPEAVERDAQRVLATPGWAAGWIVADPGQAVAGGTGGNGLAFKYGYQSEIGRIIGKVNAGADRQYILRVAGKILEIYTTSTTSTTGRTDADKAGDGIRQAAGE